MAIWSSSAVGVLSESGPALPRLLTPDDLALWLGTTRRAVYALLNRGQFRAAVIRVGLVERTERPRQAIGPAQPRF